MRPDPDHSYTFDDYLKWEGEERWELIEGRPFLMSSPTTLHQAVLGEFYVELKSFLRGHTCRVFLAPLDVKLSERDVVQPDLLVVCRPEAILPGHIEGPPELVVEIASPSSFRHDRLRKLNLYARAGIREYWLVTPKPFLLEVLSNNQAGNFVIAGSYSEQDRLRSPLFPTLELELQRLFGQLPPEMVSEPAPAYSTW